MGAKISKQIGCLSRHDDIVADNIDVVAKAWKGATAALGVQLGNKLLPQPMMNTVASHKLPDIELLTFSTICDMDDDTDPQGRSQEFIPAGREVMNAEAVGQDALNTDIAELATAAHSTDTEWPKQQEPVSARMLSRWASGDMQGVLLDSVMEQPATAQTHKLQHIDACQVRSSEAAAQASGCLLSDICPLDKEAAAAAACLARQHVEELFQAVDLQQQQQDKEQALQQLAAAGSGKALITAEEKQALREAGRAAQQAAQSQLAAALQETDETVRQMDEESRMQWFMEHACQSVEDDAEVSFDDEWSSLSPEVMAVVQQLQARQ